MASIQGERLAPQTADDVPAVPQARLGDAASGLAAADSANPAAAHEASQAAVPSPAPRAAPTTALTRAARIVGGVVRGALAAVTLQHIFHAVLGGLALGPAGIAFQLFSGTLLFWSVLQSITLHELGHAAVAEKVGDVSPRMAGQMSANPLRFTGPIGASFLLVTSMLGFPAGAFGTNVQESFGDPKNKAAMAKVAVAGPLVNFALAAATVGLIFGVKLLAPGLAMMPWIGGGLRVLFTSAFLNVALGVMNLIPLGPLDGQKVLMGFVPERWHEAIHKATFWSGAAALVGYIIYGLLSSGHTAVTQHGAGTPFGSTGDAMIMALVANGLLLWAITMWPVVKRLWARARKFLSDRRILKAGGISLALAVPVLAGKVPKGSMSRETLAVPWSGAEAGRAAVAGHAFEPVTAGDLSLAAGKAVVRRATDGQTLPVDESLIDSVRSGELLLLKAADVEQPEFVAVGSEHAGGAAEVRTMIQTATLARMAPGSHGRRLLTPVETEIVVGLSKTLGKQVYELDYEADAEHPDIGLLGRTERGIAVFVRYGALKRVAAAGPSERTRLRGELANELSGMLDRLQAAPPAAGPSAPPVVKLPPNAAAADEAPAQATDQARAPPRGLPSLNPAEGRHSGASAPLVRPFIKLGVIGAAATLALEFIVPIIGAHFGWVAHPNYIGAQQHAAVAGPLGAYLLSMLYGSVFAPFMEESVFRYGLMGGMAKVLSKLEPLRKAAPWISAVVSSLIFVALHETADPLIFGVRFVGSMLLSYAFMKEGVESSMVMHGLHNAFWEALTIASVFLGPSAFAFQIGLSALYGLSALFFLRDLIPGAKGDPGKPGNPEVKA